jgi:hypothetical protein
MAPQKKKAPKHASFLGASTLLDQWFFEAIIKRNIKKRDDCDLVTKNEAGMGGFRRLSIVLEESLFHAFQAPLYYPICGTPSKL